ncbi:Scr1 family TA system antitoxin-like transcriptional regulator [Amycolatopsis sp. NPDC049688]|uniref:Scr1 family TA system antitoxin-like transcriptional regulator n=1 Tax=Amycolatopsis sp. NPDC049688 TaxID=3154733 RepID=UPI0034327BB6
MRPKIQDSPYGACAVPTPAAVAVGLALRALRTARHIGLRQLAATLDLRAADLSSWETAKRNPPITAVAHLLGAHHADRATIQRILDQARHIDDPALVDTHGRDHTILASHYEHLATHVFVWAPTLVPYLLRTPEYHLHLLTHPFAGTGHADAPQSTEPPRRNGPADSDRRYTFLVGDTALHTCPAQLRAGQLDTLVRMAARPNITLRVVPTDVCPPGLINPFTLYGAHNVTLAAAVHHHRASTYLTGHDTLAAYKGLTRMLLNHAVDLQSVEDTPLPATAESSEPLGAAEAS